MLDDLVRGVVGTTADDPGLLAGLVVLDGDGILADVLEPNVLDGAVAVAVDTLGLVLANDGVLQGSAGTDHEDGVLVTCGTLIRSVLKNGTFYQLCLPPSFWPLQAPEPRSNRCHFPS